MRVLLVFHYACFTCISLRMHLLNELGKEIKCDEKRLRHNIFYLTSSYAIVCLHTSPPFCTAWKKCSVTVFNKHHCKNACLVAQNDKAKKRNTIQGKYTEEMSEEIKTASKSAVSRKDSIMIIFSKHFILF